MLLPLIWTVSIRQLMVSMRTKKNYHQISFLSRALIRVWDNDYNTGLEKSSVLPVLDRFLKLKTDLFLAKTLKNRSIKPCISQVFAIHRLTLLPVRIVLT